MNSNEVVSPGRQRIELGGFASFRENYEKEIMKRKNIFYSRYGKRWVDLLLTVPGFVVISPALLMIALLIKSRHGSPVLFKQVRPGTNRLYACH